MDSGDWRTQPQRKRTCEKDRHLPFTGSERLREFKKIAQRVEHEIFTVSTSQVEYSRKIWVNILTMETRLKYPISDPTLSKSAANGVNPSAPLDSTTQTRNPNGVEWQVEVYQKIQDMKDLYLLDLRRTEGENRDVGHAALEFGKWRTQLQADLRKSIVNKIMDILKRRIPYSGDEDSHERKEIAARIEYTMYMSATSQFEYLWKTSLKMLEMETRSQSPMSDPMQSNSPANTVSPWASLNSTAQTGIQNGRDRQEIKATEDPYLLDSRPIQGASGAVNSPHPTLVSGDWRAQLQRESRERIVNMIMDTLKGHFSFGNERLHELRKLAVRFEEKIYSAATSESDYLRKISLKMLSMGTRSQNPMSDPMQPNTAVNIVNPSVPLDSHNQNGGDRQEVVYRKGANGAVGHPTLESDDWRAQLQADSRQMIVNRIMSTLKRHIPLPGHKELQDMAVWFEERNYTAATSHSDYLRKISLKMLALEGVSPNSAASGVNPSIPSDPTAQTESPNGRDWQEEVFQKIKAMKDMYILDLNSFEQKLFFMMQMHVSGPQQPKNEQLESLKVCKVMLDRCMQFLQTPKQGILADFKDKLGTYEKHIISIVNSNRQKPAAPTQVQQSHPQLQHQVMPQMQSQPDQLQQQKVGQRHPNLLQRNMQQRLATAGGFHKPNVINVQTRLCPQKRATPEPSSSLGLTVQTGNRNEEEAYQKQCTAMSLLGGSNAQQNMMNATQPSSTLDPGQNSSMNPLQLVPSGSQQQDTVNWPQVPNN